MPCSLVCGSRIVDDGRNAQKSWAQTVDGSELWYRRVEDVCRDEKKRKGRTGYAKAEWMGSYSRWSRSLQLRLNSSIGVEVDKTRLTRGRCWRQDQNGSVSVLRKAAHGRNTEQAKRIRDQRGTRPRAVQDEKAQCPRLIHLL